MASDARKTARDKWDKANKVRVPVTLYRNRDADVIEHLRRVDGSRSKYIADLIREDMKRKGDA